MFRMILKRTSFPVLGTFIYGNAHIAFHRICDSRIDTMAVSLLEGGVDKLTKSSFQGRYDPRPCCVMSDCPNST